MNDWLWNDFTKEKLENLVSLGKSITEIANLYNVSYWSVYKKVKLWNVSVPKYYNPYNKGTKTKPKTKIKREPKLKLDKVIECINNNLTIKEIADKFNADISFTYKFFKKNNLQPYRKVETKQNIITYTCPDCNSTFKVSSYIPYCNNCGIKHEKINSANYLDNNSDISKQIQDLRSKKYSYSQISKELSCSKSTVAYYCNNSVRNGNIIRHAIYSKSWIGKLVKKLSDFKRRKYKKSTRTMCLDWNKKFRTRISEFCNRYKNKGNLVKKCNYKEVLEYLKGTKVNCYLTGTPIDLEKDDYCFDHIIPVSKGGTNDLSNLGITIPIANYSKSDLTVEEYLELCKKVLEHHGYTVNKI